MQPSARADLNEQGRHEGSCTGFTAIATLPLALVGADFAITEAGGNQRHTENDENDPGLRQQADESGCAQRAQHVHFV